MIQKQKLQSVISKYHLNGLIDSVKWQIENSTLNIEFISPNKDMVGKLTTPFSTIPATLAIFNTSQLNKLIGITDNTLRLDFLKQNKVFNKLTIYDGKFLLEYSLADLMLVPKTPTVNLPEENDIEVNLTLDNINSFIKAKNALPDAELVILETEQSFEGGIILSLTIGDQTDFSNKVRFTFVDVKSKNSDMFRLSFDANAMKEIFTANKTDKAKLILNKEGLMNLSFTDEDIETQYFLVQKEIY
jgi:hypothetical protein